MLKSKPLFVIYFKYFLCANHYIIKGSNVMHCVDSVSYTHLDVYKRQPLSDPEVIFDISIMRLFGYDV